MHDVIIIGGGPAGSVCAERLVEAGMDVLLVDKAVFPREKLCAGWVTPRVFSLIGRSEQDYAQHAAGVGAKDGTAGNGPTAATLQPLRAFLVGRVGQPVRRAARVDYDETVSHGIRRAEFDTWLLQRAAQAGARVETGCKASRIEVDGKAWSIDGRWRGRMLVGAGGHFCPVARRLSANRSIGPVFACQEVEVPLTGAAADACPIEPTAPELYFCDDLLGYGWCFRKGDWLNVGLGREDPRDLPGHVGRMVDWLRRQGRLPAAVRLPDRLPGHAYAAYATSARPLVADRTLLIGDAAGIADAHSGEGIAPAIESAIIAADAIVRADGRYTPERLAAYERAMVARFGPRGAGGARQRSSPRWRLTLGRWLLRRRWFVRGVVLDRWFLRRNEST